jgi:hypothetical protein
MPPRLHIQFAAGELEPEILGRTGPGEQPGWQVQRDLERYYGLLTLELRRVMLTESEALVIVAAQNGSLTAHAEDARVLWANVEDFLRFEREDKAAELIQSGDEQDEAERVNAIVARVFGSSPLGEELAGQIGERDAAVLVAKLRALTPAQSLAVVDAAERYWTLVSSMPQGEPMDSISLLRAVGLTREK